MQCDFDKNAFVADYVQAFEARDGHGVGAFYNVPCISVRADGSTHAFSERNEIDRFFTSVLETYAQDGMATFSAADMTVEPIGCASCRFTCTWSMKRKDGSIIRYWSQTYLFHKVAKDWRIIASIFHE